VSLTFTPLRNRPLFFRRSRRRFRSRLPGAGLSRLGRSQATRACGRMLRLSGAAPCPALHGSSAGFPGGSVDHSLFRQRAGLVVTPASTSLHVASCERIRGYHLRFAHQTQTSSTLRDADASARSQFPASRRSHCATQARQGRGSTSCSRPIGGRAGFLRALVLCELVRSQHSRAA
jgi:hypothetical protein